MIFYNFSACSTFAYNICYFQFTRQSISFFFSSAFLFLRSFVRVYSRWLVDLLTSCRVFIHCIFISHCTAVYRSQCSALCSWLSFGSHSWKFLISLCANINNSAHTVACQLTACVCVGLCLLFFVIALLRRIHIYAIRYVCAWAVNVLSCTIIIIINVHLAHLLYRTFTLFENKANVTWHPLNSQFKNEFLDIECKK